MIIPRALLRRFIPKSNANQYSLINDPTTQHSPTLGGLHNTQSRPSRAPLIISSVASFLWPVFYFRALEGGTVQSIQTKLPKLGTNVLLAIFVFTFLLQFFSLGLLYTYDHGSDLENHGSYNMAIFSIICIPVNGLIFLIRFWWNSVYRTVEATESRAEEKDLDSATSTQSKAAKRFAKQAVIVFAAAWLFLHWRLNHYADLWVKGFFPESEKLVSCSTPEQAAKLTPSQAQVCSPETCDWESFTAYSDLIPAGSQNIWAAWPWARTCKISGPKEFQAEINSAGEVLISGCPSSILTLHTRLRRTGVPMGGDETRINDTETPESSTYTDVLGSYYGPIISELPNTRMWSWDDKEMERDNSYQDNVLSYAAKFTRTGGVYDDSGRLMPGNLPPKIKPETEAVIVKCGNNERMVTRIATEQPSLPSSSESTSQASPTDQDEPLNVVVLFFDALARRHFFRRLPKTASLLDEMAKPVREVGGEKELTLLQLWRYIAISYNTDGSTRSLLAGKSRHDIHSTGKPIWKDYSDRGYATGYAADNCQDWITRYGSGRISRTVQGVGNFSFSEMPITEEMKAKEPKAGTLAADHEFESFACMPEFMPLLKSSRGNLKGPNAVGKRCIAGQAVHDLQFNWMNQFMKQYAPVSPESSSEKKKPFFLYGSFMESHEGSSEAIAMLDESLARFLDPKTTSIPLKNAAVFILADHGLHMGLSRLFLDQGKVEERNPFASILLPSKSIEKLSTRLSSPSTLNAEELEKTKEAAHLDAAWNEQRLTTSFDMYQTFQHILQSSTSTSSSASSEAPQDPFSLQDSTMKGPRSGKSLLSGPLADRDCSVVDIEDWLCRCHKS